MIDNILEIVSVITKQSTSDRFILGIDGLSRSGKTSLVKKLSRDLQKRHMNVFILHLDDHIVERGKRYNTGHPEWFEYYHLQWDVRWLKENLFEKLSKSKKLFLPFYDGETDTQRIQGLAIPDNCIILIEGVFLQRKIWKRYFDYVAYLDCPRKIRYERESSTTQGNTWKFRNRYWKAEEYYLDAECPKEQADAIIKSFG